MGSREPVAGPRPTVPGDLGDNTGRRAPRARRGRLTVAAVSRSSGPAGSGDTARRVRRGGPPEGVCDLPRAAGPGAHDRGGPFRHQGIVTALALVVAQAGPAHPTMDGAT